MNILEEVIAVCSGNAPMTDRVRYVLGKYAVGREELMRERDTAQDSALMFERDWKDACRERDEARAEVERLRGVLHVMSLDEYESTTSASDKVHAHARRAREALAATTASDGPSDKAHIASLEDLFLKACIRADKHKKEGADAYRRGAEAMREACARWMSEREGIAQWVYDDALSALPIPEEP